MHVWDMEGGVGVSSSSLSRAHTRTFGLVSLVTCLCAFEDNSSTGSRSFKRECRKQESTEIWSTASPGLCWELPRLLLFARSTLLLAARRFDCTRTPIDSPPPPSHSHPYHVHRRSFCHVQADSGEACPPRRSRRWKVLRRPSLRLQRLQRPEGAHDWCRFVSSSSELWGSRTIA